MKSVPGRLLQVYFYIAGSLFLLKSTVVVNSTAFHLLFLWNEKESTCRGRNGGSIAPRSLSQSHCTQGSEILDTVPKSSNPFRPIRFVAKHCFGFGNLCGI